MASGYDKIIGAQSVEWDGETITLPRLFRELERPERSTREKAWRLAMDQYLADRPAINKVWKSLFKLRSEIAANADLPDYRAYAWQERLRLEYSPDDCMRFHDARSKQLLCLLQAGSWTDAERACSWIPCAPGICRQIGSAGHRLSHFRRPRN